MLTTQVSTQINVRQALIQEIDQTPEPLLSEVLDFLLFIRAKHSPVQIEIQTGVSELGEIYDDPKEKILADLRSGLFHSKDTFESIKPKSTFALSLSHIIKKVRTIEIYSKIACDNPSID